MVSPRATYRIQLHPGFPFHDAAGITDYLERLGISHLYASPYLQAAPGSSHGYDVTDFERVNGELGGEEGRRVLCAALKERGMGQIVDVVPNHMAALPHLNPHWTDLLRRGRRSTAADLFDVDWNPPFFVGEGREGGGAGVAAPEDGSLRRHAAGDRVLLPLLGGHYGRELETGHIRIVRSGPEVLVRYFDHLLPVSREALEGIGLRGEGDWAGSSPEMTKAVDRTLERINGDPEALDRFLENQHYRLVYWRTSRSVLGYRRFFDINDMVALRMEDDGVFDRTHRLFLEWFAEGDVDGFRIDHPDGLGNPQGYLERLRRGAPGGWILVEKILMPGERLRDSWPVQGTTGYDFLNQLNGLLIHPEGEEPLTDLYARFTGERRGYREVLAESKGGVVTTILGGGLNRLVGLLARIGARHRVSRDFTENQLRIALAALVTDFPVYRTYIRADGATVDEEDGAYVLEAFGRAGGKSARDGFTPAAPEGDVSSEKGRDGTYGPAGGERGEGESSRVDFEVLRFIVDILLLKVGGRLEGEFVRRFQQFTGPAMAKGAEDTAFYRYLRFAGLNEVGGEPDRFSVSPGDFHGVMEERARSHPLAMLGTSTHDTKRSEDVRARLALLAEIPGGWAEAVERWGGMNEKHREGGIPDRNDEYLFYQSLVGAWPIGNDRMSAFMKKAVREAKVHTSWTDPDERYEGGVKRFVEGSLGDGVFTADVGSFVRPLLVPGRINSLSQLLVKLTAPGIPDIYQGSELWDLSLVDPDNRRPVDFERRQDLLLQVERAARRVEGDGADDGPVRKIAAALNDPDDPGIAKLWVVRQVLKLRRDRPSLFDPGSVYRPFHATGRKAGHLFGFLRGADPGDGPEGVRGGTAITLLPLYPLLLENHWEDTAVGLPPGLWKSPLDGKEHEGTVFARDLFAPLPVSLLVGP